MKFKDITGQQFGLLTVTHFVGRIKQKSYWGYECKCGSTGVIRLSALTQRPPKKFPKSCGCSNTHSAITHGKSHSSEYKSYMQAKTRCQARSNPAYHHYGGRGIEFRFSSFEDFYTELGNKPTPKHSVNRINNDGHYETGNVEWALQKRQVRNRRNTRYLTVNGITKTWAEWAENIPVSVQVIQSRLKNQWCDECTVSLPLKTICKHKTTL